MARTKYYDETSGLWKYADASGGTGPGGAVNSVNGKTGDVYLTAADVKARPDDWNPVVTTVIAPHGSGSKADMTASEIINAARKGVVLADYTDPKTGELRTYQYFKQMPDGRACFAINGYIEDGTPKQTLIYVDYAGNVTTETRDATAEGVGAIPSSYGEIGPYTSNDEEDAALLELYKTMGYNTVGYWTVQHSGPDMLPLAGGAWCLRIDHVSDLYGAMEMWGYGNPKKAVRAVRNGVLQSWRIIPALDEEGHLPTEQNTPPVKASVVPAPEFYGTATVEKLPSGLVMLYGRLEMSSPFSSQPITCGTIPAGFRPPSYFFSLCGDDVNGKWSRIEIGPDGAITVYPGSSTVCGVPVFNICYKGV